MSNIAFIPLRAGGRRVGLIDGKDKERADLGGHPLMAWTIRHAVESGMFSDVIAVTRSPEHAELARDYGCNEVMERPEYTVRDSSPDIEWVTWALNELMKEGELPRMYSILRVTSPFRTGQDMRAMWGLFKGASMHSARMVTPAEQHPGKMWVIHNRLLLPLLPVYSEKNPWHSQGTQTLFKAYVQTAGMEMAWSDMTLGTKTIAGSKVMPYIATGFNALDINTKFDWYKATQAVKHGLVKPPASLS
jgi:CMP-N-acetylneuraminic acid synthetase